MSIEMDAETAKLGLTIKASDTGAYIDASAIALDYFGKEERMRASAIGDVLVRLRTLNDRGQVNYHNGRLWLGDKPAEDVFAEWKKVQENWFFAEPGSDTIENAYLPGRNISGVQARLRELGGDVKALAAEAERYGLTLQLDAKDQIVGGTLLNMKIAGTDPAEKLNGGVRKPNLKLNPIVNLRLPDGSIDPKQTKKLEDMKRAKGGQALVEHWIADAKAAGYSLDGRKIK